MVATGNRTGQRSARPVQTFDRLAKKKPLELREWIPVDGEDDGGFEEAKRLLGAAELQGDEARLEAARKAYEEAKVRMQDRCVEVVFRALSRGRFEELKRAHPPTEKQVEEHKKQYGVPAEYNSETFAPVLISACCAQPQMTPSQVELLILDRCDECDGEIDPNCKECKGKSGYGWNAAEYATLFNLAIQCNSSRRVADLSF